VVPPLHFIPMHRVRGIAEHLNLPALGVRGRDLSLLESPSCFYDALLEGVASARRRITLSALYLGTGKLERQLVDAVAHALSKRDLEVTIMLDKSRALRVGPGGLSSVTMMHPILGEGGGGLVDGECAQQLAARVFLLQMPQLQQFHTGWLPSPLNEVVAVNHLKCFVFDDDCIISGANLSDTYFTTRQDRYLVARDCEPLASLYCDIVRELSTVCWKVGPKGSMTSPSQGNMLNSDLAMRLRAKFKQAAEKTATAADVDTLVMPTLQLAPLGINWDEQATVELLSMAQPSQNWRLALATAYLNPPPHYVAMMQLDGANVQVMSAGEKSHGFFGAKGFKAWIQKEYDQIHSELAASGLRVSEFYRDGWTFHAKGIWGWAQGDCMPSLMAIGSTNYGHRSVFRDLESQVVIGTANTPLQDRMGAEFRALEQHTAVRNNPDGCPPPSNPFMQLARNFF
jgi:CDP-diacylglycerol--glycerol-3-phosphate 3-phosphatidyltransferase